MCKLKKMLLGVLLKRRFYNPKQKVEVQQQDVILFQGQGNMQHAPSFMRPRCTQMENNENGESQTLWYRQETTGVTGHIQSIHLETSK